MAAPELIDILIIGSGPAGLAVATGVVRFGYKIVVFGEGVYRNTRSIAMRNFAGWDGQDPADFLTKTRSDLARYDNIQFEEANIQTVRKTDAGHFEAVDGKGRVWTGRKLVIASGAVDVFPDIPGFGECWGYGIIGCVCCLEEHHEAGSSSGIICAHSAENVDYALNMSYMTRRFTEKLTLYTNGNDKLAEDLKTALAKDKDGRAGRVTVNNQVIARLARGSGSRTAMTVTLSDGKEINEAFLVAQPFSKPRGPFAQQLSLELTADGHIKTALGHDTSLRGVWAVGDCVSSVNALARAVGQGAVAAGGVARELGGDYAKIG